MSDVPSTPAADRQHPEPPPFAAVFGVMEDEGALVRREECRLCGCSATVLVCYYIDAETAEPSGHRVVPLDACARPDRCAEKVEGASRQEVLDAAGWAAGQFRS